MQALQRALKTIGRLVLEELPTTKEKKPTVEAMECKAFDSLGRAMVVIRGLENLPCAGDRLGEFPLEERRLQGDLRATFQELKGTRGRDF